MFDLLFHGFSVALSGINPFLVVIGCLLGTIIGMLPGIGPVNAIAILFPIVLQFDMPPSSALIFFAGISVSVVTVSRPEQLCRCNPATKSKEQVARMVCWRQVT